MDQKKTGHFIAELRKAEGLTQKELAGKLQITDKAVSKWECGNSMPDYAVMVRLCDVLGVSVNELLSGERLSSVEYNKKAEENIMTLMEERSETEKNTKKQRGGRDFLWNHADCTCGICVSRLDPCQRDEGQLFY